MIEEGIVLGHKISKHGIEVDKAKIDVIPRLLPLPLSRELEVFLGMRGSTGDLSKTFRR